MNLKHPLIKTLIAILFIGAFALAFGHAFDHVGHEVHCLICHWVYGFDGLISAIVVFGVLYVYWFYFLPNAILVSHQFFLSPQGRSPPVVS